MGRTIKLLARSIKSGDTYSARVAPYLLSSDHPLYSVNDVFNAIFVHGNMLGDGMFYGSGAGKLPTASAVVGDLVAIARHKEKNIPLKWKEEKLNLADPSKQSFRFFVRSASSAAEAEAAFGKVEFIDADIPDEVGFITNEIPQSEFDAVVEKLTMKNFIRLA